MQKIILIVLMLALLSCKQQQKKRYTYDRTISFDVYSSSYWSGYVEEGDFFYTTNLGTRTMRFYDSKGKEVNRLNLEHVIIPNTTGFQVKVLTRNDIYLLDYANHFIYKLDSLANVVKKIDTAYYIRNKSLEAYFTIGIDGIEGETILLDLSFKDTLNRGSRDLRWLESKNKPILSKIEGLDNDTRLVYSNLTPAYLTEQAKKNKEEHFSSYTSAILTKNQVLFVDRSANLIYVLDRQTLQVKRTVAIESEYTDTAIGSFTFYTKEKAKTVNFTDYNYEYATSVNQIIYDPYRNTFLVVLAHRADVEKNPEQKYTNRPFSIITYDEALNKIDEQVFYNRKYDFYKSMFPTKEGLLIHSNSKMNPNYKTNTLSYDLFKI
ncbi:hypothetical protein M2306_002597 [Myroides gitamensis]|uniref:DUF4221 domain-containing protein n=1 Tax=Myroides odoratus TaxID=256 RepID=UPI0021682EDB|nr:DUF4221 domain-containing protein [Myroides odoratus]MCS4237367.1 hypothetical protein [Myroides odoratus]MDH6601903.1 hypothetical protein [Myroides gitamensis]